jgi:predicted NAD-dependent protein-ADP-ribosyltransferase YbiA (DUF1768 family)
MKTMMVDVFAIVNDKPVAKSQGELSLVTFEVEDFTSDVFDEDIGDTYDGYSINVDGKLYPIAVDYDTDPKEFMVMDAEAIDAITAYAIANPTQTVGEDEFLSDDDFEEEFEDQ